LSADQDFDLGFDLLLGSPFDVGPLDEGATFVDNRTVRLPSPRYGHGFLGLMLDTLDVIAESDETNNVGLQSFEVLFPFDNTQDQKVLNLDLARLLTHFGETALPLPQGGREVQRDCPMVRRQPSSGGWVWSRWAALHWSMSPLPHGTEAVAR